MKRIILLAMAFVLCINFSVNAAEEKVSVRTKWLVTVMSGGLIAAKHKGYFKEQGLDVEILPGGFDLDPVKLVATGRNTFGVTGADILMMAQAKGLPLVAIGVEYQQSPIVFITRKGSGITHLRDFIDKRVGCRFSTPNQTIYEALLKKYGIDRSSIDEIPMKWSIAPFMLKQVDVMSGFSINEPFVITREGVDINIIYPKDHGINFLGNVYFTSKKVIRERPDLVRKFMSAVVDGWWYTFRHRQKSIEMALKESPKLSREQEFQEYDAMLPYFVPSNGRFCWHERWRWQQTHDILLSLSLLKTPLDLNKVYNDSFLKEIYQ